MQNLGLPVSIVPMLVDPKHHYTAFGGQKSTFGWAYVFQSTTDMDERVPCDTLNNMQNGTTMSERLLEGLQIYLRRLTREDCGRAYLDMVNDVENLKYIEGLGHRQLEASDLVEYIEKTNHSASDLLLGIFEKATEAYVGNIHLSNIKPLHFNCTYGIVMSRAHIGKGYGREASYLLSRYAFEKMNMHRIHITVVDANEPARRLYESLGAVQEGVLRQSFYKSGKFYDLVAYGLLKEDFLGSSCAG